MEIKWKWSIQNRSKAGKIGVSALPETTVPIDTEGNNTPLKPKQQLIQSLVKWNEGYNNN